MNIDNKHSIRTYLKATEILVAVGRTNRNATIIMDFLKSSMDVNNECEFSIDELLKVLYRKSPVIVTKALNILRLTNIIEARVCNRVGIIKFRINGNAFSHNVDGIENNTRIFFADLNTSIIGEDGRVSKQAIDGFRVHKESGGAV